MPALQWNGNLGRGALLALGLLAALAPAAPTAISPVQRRAVKAPEPTEPVLIGCGELWQHPGRHLGRELVLQVQFDAWLEGWNPFLTRFGPSDYRAFRAWGEAQFPWRVQDYEHPRARLFVRRDSAAEWALERAERHQAFELQVAVRAVFADVPWVEVLGVRPIVRTIPEGSVLHATRALELMGRRAWGRADDELLRALAAPLPEVARAELERLRQRCAAEQAKLDARPPLRRRGD